MTCVTLHAITQNLTPRAIFFFCLNLRVCFFYFTDVLVVFCIEEEIFLLDFFKYSTISARSTIVFGISTLKLGIFVLSTIQNTLSTVGLLFVSPVVVLAFGRMILALVRQLSRQIKDK